MNRVVAGCLVLICLGCQSAPSGSAPKATASSTGPGASGPPTSGEPKHLFTAKEMAGTWRGQVVFSDKAPQNVRDTIGKQIESTVATLRPNMTFTMSDQKQKVEGTWQIVDNSVVLTRKKINGIPQADFIKQLIKKGIPADKAQSISSTEGRLDIGQDGNSLLSPTFNPQIIVMLVREKK